MSDCGTWRTDCSSTWTSRKHLSLEPPLSYTLSPLLCRRWLLPVSNYRWPRRWRFWALFWTGVWHLRSTSRWWLDRATIMHKLSDTYATYCQRSWHWHWRAAWNWRGWTTVIHYLTAHIPAVSRHYSACRTTLLGLFCNHRGGATQTCCCASSTGCWFVTESTTSWLWWLQDPQHWFTCIPEEWHKPSWINTNITFIWHFTAHCTIHQDLAREACLPMLSSICLELTTFIHHQQRLSDNLQISAENLLFPFILRL